MTSHDRSSRPALEKVIFGAGCFWGVEETFRKVRGVTATRVGYEGGHTKNPTYEEVCSHTTGHAEVVEVEFDPAALSFDELLEVFWKSHDPTISHPIGPDHGGQYRSAIFFTSAIQEAAARASAAGLEKSAGMRRAIATEIAAAPEFYPAEEYHQRYYEKHAMQEDPR
jgi:methionine-S-sulfoxide reductase